jgi:flagellar motility protein MotE (MotC chaperone)
MTKLLTSPWMNVPLGALLFLASTILFWKTPVPAALDRGPARAVVSGPSWDFANPEMDQLITELKSEKGALAVRQQQLDELASRLAAQRRELAAATAAIRQLQDDFDKSVVRIQEDEVPNLKKLAKVYAGMTPASAAAVMAQLDDTALVKILYYMKESETGAILEILAAKGPAEAKRAAAISERVRLSITQKKPPAK